MFSGSIDTVQVVPVATERTSPEAHGLMMVKRSSLDGLLSTIDWQMSSCDR